MGDQGRWFKLWCTAPGDPELSLLANSDYGCWCKFGTYLKVHGNQGKITLRKPSEPRIIHPLQTDFQVDAFEEILAVIKRFPNCTVADETFSPVSFSVTWHNWLKEQGDFSSERVRKHRDRKRTSIVADETVPRVRERRGEEKRREETTPPSKSTGGTRGGSAATIPGTEAPHPPNGEHEQGWPPELEEVRTFVAQVRAPDDLSDPTYWRRIDEWVTNGAGYAVPYLDELSAYLAYDESKPLKQRHKDHRAGFRNWLAKAMRWKDSRQQTEIHQGCRRVGHRAARPPGAAIEPMSQQDHAAADKARNEAIPKIKKLMQGVADKLTP